METDFPHIFHPEKPAMNIHTLTVDTAGLDAGVLREIQTVLSETKATGLCRAEVIGESESVLTVQVQTTLYYGLQIVIQRLQKLLGVGPVSYGGEAGSLFVRAEHDAA